MINLLNMSRMIVVCAVLLLLHGVVADKCNATNMDFQSVYQLGKQEELNCTFNYMAAKKIVLDNVTYAPNDSVSYTIFNARPTFYYRDSKQRSELTGHDQIFVTGGDLQVDIDFNWTKQFRFPASGYGSTRSISSVISFSKNITLDSGYIVYGLVDSATIGFFDPSTLKRYDPPTTLQQDLTNLLFLIDGNHDRVKVSLRERLQEQIDTYYRMFLKVCLHNDSRAIDDHFNYVWTPQSKANTTFNFVRNPVSVDIEKEGFTFKYEVQLANASNWVCGQRLLPSQPYPARLLGGTQSFIGLDFVENVVRQAISQQILDTDLNNKNWESRMFQFYAGDLYEVLPQVANKYLAMDVVTGLCKANYQQLAVVMATNITFNVTMGYNCEINIKKDKVLDITLGLQLEIKPEARTNSSLFHVLQFTDTPKFFPARGFTLKNQELAVELVRSSLRRVRQTAVFGSDWPVSLVRDYPSYAVYENYIVYYDQTHVDPRGQTQ